MKQQIENIIKKNLPEKKTEDNDEDFYIDYQANRGFNQAISQINTSLIADEVLKVVVEKIENIPVSETEDFRFRLKVVNLLRCPHKRIESNMSPLHCTDCGSLLSNLSPNKENEEFNNSSVKIDPPKPPFSGLHYQG